MALKTDMFSIVLKELHFHCHVVILLFSGCKMMEIFDEGFMRGLDRIPHSFEMYLVILSHKG